MSRILGLDYGDRRLGFALSDLTELLATPLCVAHVQNEGEALKIVAAKCRETEAVKLIVGLPLNMDATHGPRAQITTAFVEKLRKRIAIPVEFWDERLSTASAQRVLLEADVSRQRRKEVVDKLAAQIILQNYLDAQATRREMLERAEDEARTEDGPADERDEG